MEDILQCPACGHVEVSLISYRGQNICDYCKDRWQHFEAFTGRVFEYGNLWNPRRGTFLGGLSQDDMRIPGWIAKLCKRKR